MDAKSEASDACCNGIAYNSYRHACCSGVLHRRSAKGYLACCGMASYSPQTELCCCGKVRPKECGLACCANSFYDSFTQLCCGGVIHKKLVSHYCCGIHTYNPNYQMCCKGCVHSLVQHFRCCYHRYFDHPHSVHHVHVDNFVKRVAQRSKRQINPNQNCTPCRKIKMMYLNCCGTKFYDRRFQRCCGEVLHSRTHLCCAGKHIYNPLFQICCYGKVIRKHYGSFTGCCPRFDCRPNQIHNYLINSKFNRDKMVTPYDFRHWICCRGIVYRVGSTKVGDLGCCGSHLYHRKNHICCRDSVFEIKQGTWRCCGNGYFNTTKAKCCCGDRILFHDEPRTMQCCNADIYRIGSGVCCMNKWYSGYSRCCADKPMRSSQACCRFGKFGGQLYNPFVDACCDGCLVRLTKFTAFGQLSVTLGSRKRNANNASVSDSPDSKQGNDSKKIQATDDKLLQAQVISQLRRIACCGMTPYDVRSHFCCCGKIFARRLYNACCGRKPYNRSTHICCFLSLRLYARPRYNACCAGWAPYNTAIERCCWWGGVVSRTSSC